MVFLSHMATSTSRTLSLQQANSSISTSERFRQTEQTVLITHMKSMVAPLPCMQMAAQQRQQDNPNNSRH
jgi:hypothetical protein